MSHCLVKRELFPFVEEEMLRNVMHREVAMILLLQQYALLVMHDPFSTCKHVPTSKCCFSSALKLISV